MKCKPCTITKIQHGGRYTFKYPSISEAARCLRVNVTTIWKAYYCQHKCKTFEVTFETKKNFDITRFV